MVAERPPEIKCRNDPDAGGIADHTLYLIVETVCDASGIGIFGDIMSGGRQYGDTPATLYDASGIVGTAYGGTLPP